MRPEDVADQYQSRFWKWRSVHLLVPLAGFVLYLIARYTPLGKSAFGWIILGAMILLVVFFFTYTWRKLRCPSCGQFINSPLMVYSPVDAFRFILLSRKRSRKYMVKHCPRCGAKLHR